MVLVIDRRAILLWGPVMTREERAKGTHSKRESLWKNTLKENELRVVVNLRAIEALIKKEVSHRKDNQKSWRKDVDLEARKSKRKSIRYSSESDESKDRNYKSKKSTDSRFREVSERISTTTAYLQILHNMQTLHLILKTLL